MTGKLLIFGCGYSAQAFVRRLGQGWQVTGTTRDPAKKAQLKAQGIDARLWPGEDLRPALEDATHLLLSIAPGADGDPVVAALGDAVRQAAPHLRWVGYLSTTGVYGDHDGGWVDEATALEPTIRRGKSRLVAERQWQAIAAASGLPLHIFRLAGIYGPGRSALDQVRSGRARRIDKPGHLFSRIHVDDIVQVLRASMARPNAGAIYNVCDDEPAPAAEVVEHASRLLGVAPPPLVPLEKAGLSPAALGFYAESRRVRNERIKRELGVTLRHPDYRRGLAACLTGGRPF